MFSVSRSFCFSDHLTFQKVHISKAITDLFTVTDITVGRNSFYCTKECVLRSPASPLILFNLLLTLSYYLVLDVVCICLELKLFL
jgi:hypothetical protein